MFVRDGIVIYSASDLAAAARCEFSLLRAFDAQLGRGPAVSADDELLARTSRLGEEHEKRHLDALRILVGEDPTIIGRPAYTRSALAAAAESTRRAVDRRAKLIVQAAMFDGRFLGFADFLILGEGGYRLRDTKLARSVKTTALLQLAGYADALTKAGVPVLPDVELALGNDIVTSYPVGELLPVYRSRRRELERLLDRHYQAGVPVRWGDPSVRACLRCPECQVEIEETADVLLVADVRASQRTRLLDAGITTITELAEHTGPITGLSDATAEKLCLQARLQIRPSADGTPSYAVVNPAGLGCLPPPSPGDLFFDFEGDPLWTADGKSWGLEYLFGILGAGDDFTPLWSDDRIQERDALLEFLKLVRERRAIHPDMHIYHYASYEKTALLKLAGQYGVGEEEVDDLLRDEVLVDLYPLVRNSIRVGTDGYGLKALEPLFMGDERRDGDVTTAADSILEYDRYCTLTREGEVVLAESVRAAILDYNKRDCWATLKLRDWLLARAREHGVQYREPTPRRERERDPIDEDDTARALMGFAGDPLAGRTPEQQAVAMVAAARGYHKREDKPHWWKQFQRLDNRVDDWVDTAGVFLIDHAEVEEDWQEPTGRQTKHRRRLRLAGAVDSGDFGTGAAVAMYEAPAPTTLDAHSSGRACNSVTVNSVDNPAQPSVVVVTELNGGQDGEIHTQMPFALVPSGPVSTTALRTAIDVFAQQVQATLPRLPGNACVDILTRRPPRLRSGTELPRGDGDIADITAALLALDNSYVAVHGPPGSGKTYCAARVIATLAVEHGWKIGVVAQSHDVVENLLDKIAELENVDCERVGKRLRDGESGPRPWRVVKAAHYPAFIAESGGCVVGGTAWDFAKAAQVPPGCLDLLVIEEAGQFCLANTIAVCASARNLLLLGDPQQLPQVSQGTHVEPVNESALGWLVDGAPTLDPSLGYFLARSWRMHSAVCGPVSRLAYGGLLHSEVARTDARILAGRPPGVFDIFVDHAGESTDSPQEARRIVEEITGMLGTEWTDENGTRPLLQSDFRVVAGYNAQVRTIRRHLDDAGLRGVAVGTVDRFQGQEGVIVFFSLAASSIDDVPHGISFLLNRNRVNVAISRAEYAAYIVRSPQLTEYLPPTPDGLTELGAFLALT